MPPSGFPEGAFSLFRLNGFGVLIGAGYDLRPAPIAQCPDEQDAADTPGDRISGKHHSDVRNEVYHCGNVQNTEYTPNRKHDDHGRYGLTGSAQNRCTGVGKAQHAEKERFHMCLPHTVNNYFRSGAEQADKLRRKQEEDHTYKLGKAGGHQHTHTGTLPDTAGSSGAQVLSHKGGHGHCKAGDGQENEAFHAGVAGAAGHGSSAEGVDIRLHHHVGNGNNAVLNAAGNA